MSTKVIMVVAAFALTTALSLPAPAQAGSRSQAYDRPAGAYAQQVKRTHRVHRGRNASRFHGSRSNSSHGDSSAPIETGEKSA